MRDREFVYFGGNQARARVAQMAELETTPRARVDWGGLLDDVWGNNAGDSADGSRLTVQDNLLCSGSKDREKNITTRTTATYTEDSREPPGVPCSVENESRAVKEAATFTSGMLFPDSCVSRGKENKRRRQFWAQLGPVIGDDKRRRKQRTLARTNGSTLQRRHTVSSVTGKNKCKKLQQLCLDFGQKKFGHVTCELCGMVYTFGQTEDEREHVKFHRKYLMGVSFRGWKNERVAGEFSDGRIITVFPSDPKHHLKKVHELCAVVDSELGYASGVRPWNTTTKIYLYISTDKKVMGCVFAEKISQGYPVLSHFASPSTFPTIDSTDTSHSTPPSLKPASETNSETTDDGGSRLDTLSAWYCSSRPQPAAVGVNRVWVCQQYRRMGVASRILDTVRFTFLPGDVVSKEQLAFSDPTPSGKALATSYCNTENFIVYHWTT